MHQWVNSCPDIQKYLFDIFFSALQKFVWCDFQGYFSITHFGNFSRWKTAMPLCWDALLKTDFFVIKVTALALLLSSAAEWSHWCSSVEVLFVVNPKKWFIFCVTLCWDFCLLPCSSVLCCPGKCSHVLFSTFVLESPRWFRLCRASCYRYASARWTISRRRLIV